MSLEKYLTLNLRPIEQQLNELKSAIQKLTVTTVEHDQLKYQVASQSEALQELEKTLNALDALEKRIDQLEQFKKIVYWVFGVVSSIGVALLIQWLSGFIS